MSKSAFGSGDSGNLPQAQRTLAETLLSPSLLEAIPDAMVAVNQEGIMVQVNSQSLDLFGYTRDELIGRKIEMLVPERQRQQHLHHRQRFTDLPKVRRMGAGLDLHGRRRDGSEFPVEISLSPIAAGDGLLVLSAIRDISDRKRIEEELRRVHADLERRKDRQLRDSESRLALAIDSSQDAIIGKSLEGIITHWNKGAESIYGYKPEEVIGKSISILAPKERSDEIPGILERIRHAERVEYFETVRVTKDGRRLNVSISVSPVRDAEGNVVAAFTIARNITAQKRAEEQLLQAQKMESVGRLAGGIAHDFNNLLGIITASSELLRGCVSENSEALPYLANIRQASERGASLTRQLLTFSRKQALQPRVLDLNQQMKEVSKLLRPLLGDAVQMTLNCRPTTAIVEADPSQLDQIVVNLALNARDAMPGGGKLILETAVMDFDQEFAAQHPPLSAGRYVMLAVSDNGTGMDDKTVAHIFEPFFTTKETGRGTGLGLATVYGIVNQSHGHVWVYSELGRGTTFKIYLPSAEHKLGVAVPCEADALPPRAEGKTVLVVEDEDLMRTLTRQMLEAHGYRVIEASEGKAALEHLAAGHDSIDITLTDVVMRGMSGPELALRLTESHPAMKVVFMSGYAGDLISDKGALIAGVNLLEKPFTRAALLKTIHQALG
jgi:PAS domain S-box-containing protein